jgi:hypothetical protein
LASEKSLTIKLQHPTCIDISKSGAGPPASRPSSIASTSTPPAQDPAPSALFTPGLAFALLLRAKLDSVKANLQNAHSWVNKLSRRLSHLTPSVEKLRATFKRIFDDFERSRDLMAKTYLDVKKSKEVFSACELELKLASKGSISASTLSDRMLKMNAARDKSVESFGFLLKNCVMFKLL